MEYYDKLSAEQERSFFEEVARKRLPFTLYLRGGRVEKNARLRGKDGRYLLLSSDRKVDFGKDVVALSFRGSWARSARTVLSRLGELQNRRVHLYPYGRRREPYRFLNSSPYAFFVESRGSLLVIPKVALVAFTFSGYPDSLIEEGAPTSPLVGGTWRNDWKELAKLLKKELQQGRSDVVLYLKDGKEVRGTLDKKSFFRGDFFLRLYTKTEDGKTKYIQVFKHAVEDYGLTEV
jgi:hypothetical protein